MRFSTRATDDGVGGGINDFSKAPAEREKATLEDFLRIYVEQRWINMKNDKA